MTRQRLLPPVNRVPFTLRAVVFAIAASGLLMAHPAAALSLAATLVIWWLGIMYTRLLLVKRQSGWQPRFVASVLVLLGTAVVTVISAWVLVAALLQWFLPHPESN